VHTVEELERLFSRVEQVLDRPRSGGEQALIALVLHGPEVEFFALKNYTNYKTVVDRAAKLAALGAVDISICQTQMRNYGIAPDEVPSFLHQVPFGPDEVQRLIGEGYVYM
jgi:intracellular sulfur oxidation DsrE/DsrF family protein